MLNIIKGMTPDPTLKDKPGSNQRIMMIDVDTFESMGKNTPFNGWSVNAQVKETIVDGKTVWKG